MKIIGLIIILISVLGFCHIHYKKPDKKIFFLIASIFALIVGIGLGADSVSTPDTPTEGSKIVRKTSKDYGPQNKAAKISSENKKAKESLSKKQSDVQKKLQAWHHVRVQPHSLQAILTKLRKMTRQICPT
ncbi:hypothetical protein PSR59_05935 [Ligilactobacillus ruminis]|uniref:Uncharacterized protein n=1 Tax=Ligilactobacillus ruminis TaxID=1623 RepID=A0AAQ2XIB2_9LACO|nr:hypothetical protein [Ligilactobacillus ruminis]WDC81231.1 hypothetical protein PSR59_05935 [Ligilactobacillus ruminis]